MGGRSFYGRKKLLWEGGASVGGRGFYERKGPLWERSFYGREEPLWEGGASVVADSQDLLHAQEPI